MFQSQDREGRSQTPPSRVTLLPKSVSITASAEPGGKDQYALAELERRHERTDRMIRMAREQLQ